MWRGLAVIVPLALLLAAAWFALLRFTLLDIPAWPGAMLFGACLLVAVLFAFARPVANSSAALYLDRRLDLDERLSAFLELSGRLRYRRLGSRSQPPATKEQVDVLGHETARLLRRRKRRMPGRLDARITRTEWWALGLALVAFLAAMFTPTELDAVRADREALRRTVAVEVQRVRDLRADIVARPNLSDDVRRGLLTQLDSLQKQLAQPGIDRASILAALSDTQDKLRSLTPYSTSEFTSLIRAAQMVQEAAIADASWDPATTLETTDLAKAAVAAEAISDALPQFSTGQLNDAAQRFFGASNQAAAQDVRIAQKLAEISSDLRDRSRDTGAIALRDLATQFRAADRNQQLAESVEQAMSKLDEGKQSLAQSEQSSARKPQVGFRRGDLPGASASSQTPGAQQGEQQTAEPGQGLQGNDQSASSRQAGPGMGANVPAFGLPGSGTGGTASQTPGSQGKAGAGGPSDQSGQTGASTGQQQSGGTGSGTSSGAGSGGAGGTGSGTMQGSLTGPVTGGGGAISKVPNPEGVGVGGTSQIGGGGSGSQGEQVYVPAQSSTSGSTTGSADKSQGTGSGEPGSTGVGSGGAGQPQGNGPGALTQLRTPYTDVVREYAQKATDALERAYVPPDAKQYVKDYFAQLGKQ